MGAEEPVKVRTEGLHRVIRSVHAVEVYLAAGECFSDGLERVILPAAVYDRDHGTVLAVALWLIRRDERRSLGLDPSAVRFRP